MPEHDRIINSSAGVLSFTWFAGFENPSWLTRIACMEYKRPQKHLNLKLRYATLLAAHEKGMNDQKYR